jgi:predicted transposase YdaD
MKSKQVQTLHRLSSSRQLVFPMLDYSEELYHLDQPGLLPLVPLTTDGAKREVVETMFADLNIAERSELIPIGAALASLAFGKDNTADQELLIRRLLEMKDILQETPVYQALTQQARQEGLEEGRQEGCEALRQTLLSIVQTRFPKLVRLAREQAVRIDDPDVLGSLIVKISFAQTTQEAKQYLRSITEDEN